MSAWNRAGIIAVACTLALGACSDSTEPEEERLAMEEATALLIALRTVGVDTTVIPIFASPDSIIVPCPINGTAKLVGTIEEGEPIEGTATLKTDFVVTPRGCGVAGGGFAFTVDGNPSIRDIVNTSINVTTFEILVEGTLNGALDWNLGGRTGTCAIDLTLSGEPDFSGAQPGFSASYTGTLCGYDVDLDASELFNPLG